MVKLTTTTGNSMLPTLYDGEYICIDKSRKAKQSIKRGDIICFKDQGKNTWKTMPLCKRVIGLPGDEIIFKDKKVYVNGEVVKTPMRGVPKGPNVECVPPFRYYVLGDNVGCSRDSRTFGCIPYKWLYGVVTDHKHPKQVKDVKLIFGKPVAYKEAYRIACNMLGIKNENNPI